DEDHRRLRRGPTEDRRLAEQLLDLIRERVGEVVDVAAPLEAAEELGRGRDAHGRPDQCDLEALPGIFLRRVERGAELRDERAPAFPERLAEAREEACALGLFPLAALGVTQQL